MNISLWIFSGHDAIAFSTLVFHFAMNKLTFLFDIVYIPEHAICNLNAFLNHAFLKTQYVKSKGEIHKKCLNISLEKLWMASLKNRAREGKKRKGKNN